jgi:hypothetical protein
MIPYVPVKIPAPLPESTLLTGALKEKNPPKQSFLRLFQKNTYF